MYEMTGTVKKVGETIANANGYSQRTLVVVEKSNSYRPNVVPFAFCNGNCAKLDNLVEGAEVKVSFTVSGWEWNSPSGEVKNSLRLMGVEAQAVDQPAESAPPVALPSADDGQLPF